MHLPNRGKLGSLPTTYHIDNTKGGRSRARIRSRLSVMLRGAYRDFVVGSTKFPLTFNFPLAVSLSYDDLSSPYQSFLSTVDKVLEPQIWFEASKCPRWIDVMAA